MKSATVKDIGSLNRLVRDAPTRANVSVVFRRQCEHDLQKAVLITYGASAFANAEGDESQ